MYSNYSESGSDKSKGGKDPIRSSIRWLKTRPPKTKVLLGAATGLLVSQMRSRIMFGKTCVPVLSGRRTARL